MLRLCCVLLVIALFLLRRPVEVHSWGQPTTINYQSYHPYAVRVFDVSPVLWPYPQYEVLIGQTPDYGHVTEYGFHNYGHEANYFERCKTEWTPEGITLIEPTGHKLFIPKDAFINDR